MLGAYSMQALDLNSQGLYPDVAIQHNIFSVLESKFSHYQME